MLAKKWNKSKLETGKQIHESIVCQCNHVSISIASVIRFQYISYNQIVVVQGEQTGLGSQW